MTDPIYGDNPIDAGYLWDLTFRPPLLQDPEWQIWRTVVVGMFDELLESQWLTRWRRSLMTAEGAQLDIWGEQLSYLQPAGWTEERWRNVLIALAPASFGHATTDVVFALADALLDVGQSYGVSEELPLASRFTFFETDLDDAGAYLSALNRARASGANYIVVSHPGPAPFTIGTSTIGGADTLGNMGQIADIAASQVALV